MLATAAAGCVTTAFDDAGERLESPAAGDPSSHATNARSTGDAAVIEVRADGVVETAPYQATLSLGVEARGDSATAITDALAERVEALRTTVAEFGIPDEDVESGRYDVR